MITLPELLRVSFFLNNASIPSIDLSTPELGNPGCGGTEYAFASLVKELSKNTQIVISLYAPIAINLGSNIAFYPAASLEEAIALAEKHNSILVYRPSIKLSIELETRLKQSKAKIVAWCHVSPNSSHLRSLQNIPSIKAVVSMGGRQFYSWRDNPVFAKTINIPNGQYPFRLKPALTKEKIVTYLGALVPQKGFHVLAAQWPKVIATHPDAILNVIGSGALYSEYEELGPERITGEIYENLILKLLGDSRKSVNFLGKLSSGDKNLILANTYLGVVNPVGSTENCPASALDFQSAQVPVIAGKRNGLIDTIVNGKSGILISDINKLNIEISYLLSNEKLTLEYGKYGRKFVEENFDFKKITKMWLNLLQTISQDLENDTSMAPKPRLPIEFCKIVNYYLVKNLLFWKTFTELKILIVKIREKLS